MAKRLLKIAKSKSLNVHKKTKIVFVKDRPGHDFRYALNNKKASKKLVGTKDFSTFRASSCRAKSPIKTMKSVKVKSRNDKINL